MSDLSSEHGKPCPKPLERPLAYTSVVVVDLKKETL